MWGGAGGVIRDLKVRMFANLDMFPTCPLSSSWLFVNLSLSKDTTCFIHWAPLAGESGWTWILGGELGSALPATTQLLVWNAYLRIKISQISKLGMLD